MYITVNGIRLFFDVDGEGLAPDGPKLRKKPSVILVHGGPGADHSIAKPYFSQITDIAQVIYYDQRGNGRSDLADQHTWSLEHWADDLKGLCDALGVENPIVIGTSFGGFVSLAYATKYPDHPGALVLISTAASVDFSVVYDAFERLGGQTARDVAQSYWEAPSDEGRELYKSVCLPLYTRAQTTSQDRMARVLWRNETALWFNGPNNEHGRFDFTNELPKITCPVLVLAGEEDPITPPSLSDALVAGLHRDQVTYLRFPECGHGVTADRPEEALDAIRAFIERIRP